MDPTHDPRPNCSSPHGDSWRLEVGKEGENIDRIGRNLRNQLDTVGDLPLPSCTSLHCREGKVQANVEKKNLFKKYK